MKQEKEIKAKLDFLGIQRNMIIDSWADEIRNRSCETDFPESPQKEVEKIDTQIEALEWVIRNE